METKITKIGDIVTFGQYPQGANGEVEPLEWRVLAIEDDTALLLTEKCIECLPYNEEFIEVTWENCTLRRWMNSDFISKAFTSDEQIKIVTSTLSNDGDDTEDEEFTLSIVGVDGEEQTKTVTFSNDGNDTQDKVFALSIPEAEKYFADDKSRSAYATEYAKKKGCYVNDDIGTTLWRLRSPGNIPDLAAFVYDDGFVDSLGSDVDGSDVAVRPACRVKLQ